MNQPAKTLLALFVIFIAYGVYHFDSDVSIGFYFDIVNFTQSFGYEIESHSVRTEDNYNGIIHRLIPKNPPSNDDRPAVAIFGGVGCSSLIQVISGPEKAYSFVVSDAGYDVWLLNARGSRYFTQLSPDTVFSFHEIGYYDIAAGIDYITNKKNGSKVQVIVQSMGCTALMILLSERPEYNEKISQALCLGMVFNEFKNASYWYQGSLYIVQKHKWFGDEFYFTDFKYRELFFHNCKHPYIKWLCVSAVRAIAMYGGPFDNMTHIGHILHHGAKGSAFGIGEHTRQIYERGEFSNYDHGKEENLRRYGTEISPRYPLEKITIPIRVYYTEDDEFATPKITMRNLALIKNLNGIVRVPKPFTHTHFVMNGVKNEYILEDIVNSLKK